MSADGESWTSATAHPRRGDLRDPKLEIAPDGKLMMVGFITLYEPTTFRHESLVWFSGDGKTWTEAASVGEKPLWIWRPTRRGDELYAMGYACEAKTVFRLYRAQTGTLLSAEFGPRGRPSGGRAPLCSTRGRVLQPAPGWDGETWRRKASLHPVDVAQHGESGWAGRK